MIALFCFLLTLSVSPFKSKSRLEAENAALRHQLIVLQRRVRGRVQLTNGDRVFLVLLYRWFPSVLRAITIIRPETLVRWHRAGFAITGVGNPENSIRRDSRGEAESAHHPMRWLRSSTCLQRL
jgi:hypothetical protein